MNWPLARYDHNLSGRSTGKGDIQKPAIQGEVAFYSGNTIMRWIEDINHDGVNEYISIECGRIKVKDAQGLLLWQSDICNPRLIGYHDLEGKGRETYIVAVTNFRTLAVFSSLTGEICWEYTFKEKTVMLYHNTMRIGPIDPSLKGEQITVWPEGDDYGYLFSFDEGVRQGRTVWMTKGIGIGERSRYRPNVLFGEVEGNGLNSIVVIQHSIIWVVDVTTGSVKWEAVGPKMRNYGFAGLFDIDLDGQLELVLVNDAVQQRIAVVKLEGNEFKYVWNNDLGYSEHVMKMPYFPVRDIDGDGQLEIIYSIGELNSKAWEVQILNAATGRVKYTIPDARLLDFGNQDPEGNVELLLENIASLEFEVRKLHGDNAELYRTKQAIQSFISDSLPAHCNHVAHDRMEVYFHDFDQDGQLELMVVDQGKQTLYGYSDTGRRYMAKVTSAIDESRVMFSVPLDEIGATPVVTDIDGDGTAEIMLGETVYYANGKGSDGKLNIAKKWSLRGAKFLVAGDSNLDGYKELLFAGANAELIMTNCHGEILWRKLLKGDFIGGWIKDCTVGRFLTADTYDIFANVSSGPTYINECMVIRASDGEIIWRRSDGHDSGMGPVDGMASIRPLEEDGLDDLLFLSGDVLAGIDGATGHNLMEMKSLSEILGTMWLGSGQFTFVDVDDDGVDEIYLSGIWGLNGGVLKWDGTYWRSQWFDYYGNSTPIGTPPYRCHQGIAYAQGKVLAGGQRSDYRYGCMDASTGQLLWTYELGDSLIGDTCTGDIDGDGQDEFVFGCNDGYLYGLKCDGTIHSRLYIGAPVGSPIVADVDADGHLEILVTTTDGRLLIVK
jgi:outer membrane protein assembly factor BamB